jgi:hypothetical protein
MADRELYRYEFNSNIPFKDIEECLFLAVFAAESLHGRSLVRLNASFCLNAEKRACVVDASTGVGRSIASVFVGFLTREFGEDAFRVRRVERTPKPEAVEARQGSG